MQIKRSGFTFVELIVVILLISILSITVLPRFLDARGFDEVAFQQRLISLLRLQQTKAMQQTNNGCHRVLITSSRFGVTYSNGVVDCTVNTLPVDYSALTNFEQSHYGLSQSDVANTSISFSNHDIYFTSLGCPTSGLNGTCGSADININIDGQSTVQVCIESQGYIHEGECDNGVP